MNVTDFIGRYAATQGEVPALIDGERTVSYGELDGLVRRTARHLRDLGVQPGERIGINLKERVESAVLMLAAGWMGVSFVPIDWRARPAERARLAAAMGVRLVLVEPSAPPLPEVATVAVGEEWREAIARATPEETPSPGGDAELYVALSSGTTGLPKGAPCTHTMFRHRLGKYTIAIGQSQGHRYVSVQPLSHAAGWHMLFLMLSGGSTVVLHPILFSAEEYLDAVTRHQATFALLVPTVLRWLLKLPPRADGQPLLPWMRTLVTAADVIRAEEKRAVFQKICPGLIEMYATSVTGNITILQARDIMARAETVGQPNLMVDLEIVDEDHRPVPRGEVGRLRVRGPGTATGYVGTGSEEATRNDFRDGWFYPGELAARDGAGFVTIQGRASNVIIRGGANVYPEELEAVIERHPAVAAAAVVGKPHPELGEEVVALVVARDGLDPREILAFCRRELSPQKAPAHVQVVADLPRTGAGKIRRAELRQLLAQE